MTNEDLQRMLFEAATQMPPPQSFQPENELKPDPARLRARLDYLEIRVETLERWAAAMNPTFWNYHNHATGNAYGKSAGTDFGSSTSGG